MSLPETHLNLGNAFLIKISNGETVPSYTTVAGLRLTRLKEKLRVGGVIDAITIKGTGVFTGLSAEKRLKNNAFSGVLDDYELSFSGGERLQGKFLITQLDYAGELNGDRSYALTLESSGEVVKP